MNINGFDIVKRYDGSFAIYDYAWWPDEYLDSFPDALEVWLEGTLGWRAKGWQIVHVVGLEEHAVDWCNGRRDF